MQSADNKQSPLLVTELGLNNKHSVNDLRHSLVYTGRSGRDLLYHTIESKMQFEVGITLL
jgi:hypothetical protein